MPNLLLQTDSYKLTHYPQYPPDSKIVYSYLESRGGDVPELCFFPCLQYYLEKYLAGQVVTQEEIDEAVEFSKNHFGTDLFNREGWEYILHHHYGRLPLAIKAAPEGMVIPVNNVLMTVYNTDERVPWITNYVESLLLKVWYPITVATRSREIKKIIKQYLDLTGDPTLLPFKLHDFGYRGVSSEESAGIGGAAHLVNFLGSDTIAGIQLLREYYQPSSFPGFSIPASEHSTMTSWGQEHEVDAMANMLEKYPTGLVACVSDSYDIANACDNLWGVTLKDQVLARDGVLVIRPDSGDPTPTMMRLLGILESRFGTTVNSKGYKELNSKVRLIQGDGVNLAAIRRMLDTMKWQGWSANNIAFGCGGGLLQQMDRDTHKFAFKCSAIKRADSWHDVYKTATGKASKRGRLSLVRDSSGGFATCPFDEGNIHNDILQDRFHNGHVYNSPKLDDIRQRAEL